MQNIRVTGADQLRFFGRECTRYGRKDLKVELIKQVQREMKATPIREMIAESALDTLPNGGGHERGPRPKGKRKDGTKRKLRRRSRRKRTTLAGLAAQTRVVVKVITGGRNVGVVIRGAKGKTNLNALNRGKARHPTYGHKPWVLQDVKPGFFDEPLKGEVSDDFRRAILATINEFIRALRSGGSGSRAA
ncbi:MAG TPA: hypothetical protein PKA64_04690 [Myxococcota bacterium]|nr:hypothetical protein [Myxococcota bacterium]